jgi:hypothetical protein
MARLARRIIGWTLESPRENDAMDDNPFQAPVGDLATASRQSATKSRTWRLLIAGSLAFTSVCYAAWIATEGKAEFVAIETVLFLLILLGSAVIVVGGLGWLISSLRG